MFAEVIGNENVTVWYFFLKWWSMGFPYIDWQDYYGVAF